MRAPIGTIPWVIGGPRKPAEELPEKARDRPRERGHAPPGARRAGSTSPCLVKLPGQRANAGTVNHSFFHVWDIMPTLLDAAGVTPPREIDGRKVRPLQGRSVRKLFAAKTRVPYAGADDVGYETFGMKACFAGRWKILWMPKPVGKGEWELFDLKQDPAEMNDLSGKHPERLEAMIARWEQYKKDNGGLDIALDHSGAK
ncbi:MAG: sulfatase/phosphatase domain-containing protein [Planctomycetota bacterium]